MEDGHRITQLHPQHQLTDFIHNGPEAFRESLSEMTEYAAHASIEGVNAAHAKVGCGGEKNFQAFKDWVRTLWVAGLPETIPQPGESLAQIAVGVKGMGLHNSDRTYRARHKLWAKAIKKCIHDAQMWQREQDGLLSLTASSDDSPSKTNLDVLVDDIEGVPRKSCACCTTRKAEDDFTKKQWKSAEPTCKACNRAQNEENEILCALRRRIQTDCIGKRAKVRSGEFKDHSGKILKFKGAEITLNLEPAEGAPKAKPSPRRIAVHDVDLFDIEGLYEEASAMEHDDDAFDDLEVQDTACLEPLAARIQAALTEPEYDWDSDGGFANDEQDLGGFDHVHHFELQQDPESPGRRAHHNTGGGKLRCPSWQSTEAAGGSSDQLFSIKNHSIRRQGSGAGAGYADSMAGGSMAGGSVMTTTKTAMRSVAATDMMHNSHFRERFEERQADFQAISGWSKDTLKREAKRALTQRGVRSRSRKNRTCYPHPDLPIKIVFEKNGQGKYVPVTVLAEWMTFF